MSIPTPLFEIIGFTVLLLIIVIILVVLFVQLSGRSRNSQAKTPKKGSAKAHPVMQEILRLWRDPDTGRVITEFQNRPIRDPRTLSQTERDYLVRLAQDWSTWLAIPEAQPVEKVEASPAVLVNPIMPASPDVPAGPAAELAPAAAADVAAAPATPADAKAQVIAPTAVVDVAAAEATPAYAEAQVFAPAPPVIQAAPVVTPPPAPPTPRSIVEQVDDILQEKLASHPTPALTIRLVEDPRGGVFVWVNNDKFEGIESVTDPAVRMIIRSAVVEWEHRTEK
jgi:hypothetical protein